MKRSFCFWLLVLSLFTAAAQSADEVIIRKTMAQQVDAWNKGDLESFMIPYWHSDSLMFIGKSGITYGWTKTLENYKKGYPDTATMGKLKFDLLEVKRLSPEYFSVVGKWFLTRSAGNVGGHFTLLIRRINKQWLIVSDHSS